MANSTEQQQRLWHAEVRLSPPHLPVRIQCGQLHAAHCRTAHVRGSSPDLQAVRYAQGIVSEEAALGMADSRQDPGGDQPWMAVAAAAAAAAVQQ